MDDILRQSLLYDFYGELLTEHQRDVYRQYTLEDLSLGEIAQETGISRQGVHDLVKRCQQSLEQYEAKLHLVERFTGIRGKIKEMDALVDSCTCEACRETHRKIRALSEDILKEL